MSETLRPEGGFRDKFLTWFKKRNETKNAKIDSLRNIISQNNSPSLQLVSFSGIYNNEVYGDINIKLENKKLNVYFSNHPNLIGKLEHLKTDTFLCTYSNSIMGIEEIPFKIVGEKVVGLTLCVDNFVEFTSYEFIKYD